MFTVIGIMVTGILTGYLLRNQAFIKKVNKAITVTIILLLFLLGIAVGANQQIMSNLSVIGLQAGMLSIGGVLGSVVCAWAVYRFYKKGEGKA